MEGCWRRSLVSEDAQPWPEEKIAHCSKDERKTRGKNAESAFFPRVFLQRRGGLDYTYLKELLRNPHFSLEKMDGRGAYGIWSQTIFEPLNRKNA